MIQYACVNDKPGFDELETDNLIEYMAMSETNIRSEVEKKRLIYVSNYLFDRYNEHQSKLKEILERLAREKENKRVTENVLAKSESLNQMKKIITELSNRDHENREELEELKQQVISLKD